MLIATGGITMRHPIAIAVCAVAFLPLTAPAQSTARIRLERVATGLQQPVFVTSAPGVDDRLFIVEQTGDIQILNLSTGQLAATPLATIDGLASGGEQGLLGLAFDPDFANNGHFYTNAVKGNGAGRTFVERHTVTGDRGTPTSIDTTQSQTVIAFDQLRANHNAGWLGFSPRDNHLYIATGDSGGGNDPDNVAQNLSSPLGKILRIDPSGDDFLTDDQRNYAVPTDNPFVGDGAAIDEIWAYGLRNPFRNSFDASTGDLLISDVGQNQREEVNFQSADSNGGENYGWRIREGGIATPGINDPAASDLTEPVYDYEHGFGDDQGNSIVGGYVYRGNHPELEGRYLFADTFSDNLWMMSINEMDPMDFDEDADISNFERLNDRLDIDQGSLRTIVSFGEDNDNNVYVATLGGDVFRFAPAVAVPEPGSVVLLAVASAAWYKRRCRSTVVS